MRKFCCLLLAVLIFVFGIKPATEVSALGTSEDYDEYSTRYGVLQFDRVEFTDSGVTYSYPYPFNSSLIGSHQVPFEYDFLSGYCSLSSDESSMVGVMRVPLIDGVLHLYGGPQLSTVARLYDEWDGLSGFSFFKDDASIFVRSVTVDFSVWILNDDGVSSSGKIVGSTWRSFSVPVYRTAGGIYQIGDAIHEALVSSQSEQHYFIGDIHVAIDYERISGVDTPEFTFSIGTSANDSAAYFSTWVYEQNIPLVINNVSESLPSNVFDWLVDAVESFLSFEIAPGLSITKILNLILVIGIFLWFITLLI